MRTSAIPIIRDAAGTFTTSGTASICIQEKSGLGCSADVATGVTNNVAKACHLMWQPTRQRHRRDLDVRVVLVAFDLEEDVADPHGGTLLMGDDDLNLLHEFIVDA